MESLIAHSSWFLPGISLAIAVQLAISFSLGWYLRSRKGRSLVAAPAPPAESLVIALETVTSLAANIGRLAAHHNAKIAEFNDELRVHTGRHRIDVAEQVLAAGSKLLEMNDRLQGRVFTLLFEMQQHVAAIDGGQSATARSHLPVPKRIVAGVAAGHSEPQPSWNVTSTCVIPPNDIAKEQGRVATSIAQTDSQLAKPRRERREYPRQPFPCVQHVAPFEVGRPLKQEQFEPVLCHDLSATGFSYHASEPPEHRLLIVQFGAPPDHLYVKAEVMHASQRTRDGKRTYIVGCKFIERAERYVIG